MAASGKKTAPPWKRPRPKSSKAGKKKLQPWQIAAARKRAMAAKRRYPNLVDNMWAAKLTRAADSRKPTGARHEDPLI